MRPLSKSATLVELDVLTKLPTLLYHESKKHHDAVSSLSRMGGKYIAQECANCNIYERCRNALPSLPHQNSLTF